jgi:cyanophycinase
MDGTGIVGKFIQLAGGPDKKFIIVPTAGGNKNDDGTVRPYAEAEIVASWQKRGIKNVKMLHTHDPKVADTDAFVKEVKDADAVWFNGGRQWTVDSTPAQALTEFRRCSSVAASSAAARQGTIQGQYLVRGDTSDRT